MNQDEAFRSFQVATIRDPRYSPPPDDAKEVNSPFPFPEPVGPPTEFAHDEIVIAIDIERQTTHKRVEADPFSGKYKHWTETVRSGNGQWLFQPIEEALQSELDPTREQYLSREIADKMIGVQIPGDAIAIDRKNRVGRIVSMLDTKEGREDWERLRRLGYQMKVGGWMKLILAAPREPKVYQLDEIGLWTWMFYLRNGIDREGIKRRGIDDWKKPRGFKEIQNYDWLPSREEVVNTHKARFLAVHPTLAQQAIVDEKLRAARFANPDRYRGDGMFSPANAGYDPEADFITPMTDLRIM